MLKTGAGVMEVGAVRNATLNLSAGELRIVDTSGSLGLAGSSNNTSIVNALTIAGGTIATARLDISNNDVVVDYSGTSPLGTGSTSVNSVIFKQVQSGYASGTWNGNGIASSTAFTAGTLEYGVGFAEASDVLTLSGGTASWSGQTVDGTSALIKFTWVGDSTLDGTVDVSDFARLSAAFNTTDSWARGDYNYDGVVNITDFALQSANFNETGLRGGGETILQQVYVMMLENPQLYWEAKFEPDIWFRFEEFENMGLGDPPPMPEGFRVPEPGMTLAVLLIGAVGARHRKS